MEGGFPLDDTYCELGEHVVDKRQRVSILERFGVQLSIIRAHA